MKMAEGSSHEQQHGREQTMISSDLWSEIRRLAKLGKPIKQIAREFDLSKNTVKKALRSTCPPTYERTLKKRGVLDEYMPFVISRASEVNFNATILFRELKEKGYSGGYTTVKTAIRPLRADYRLAQAASIRFETPPGHQAQMDWGSTWVIVSGQRIRVRIFVIVLSYSRSIYVEFVLDEKLPTLIRCHENAFRWFGGVTEEILYDNPRTIVLDRGTENARLHPQFQDFCRYWGYQPRLCRPYRARTKGKVESGVKYIKRSFLPGRVFSSLSDINEQVWHWIRTVADQRIHGTVHEKPVERFQREKLQSLGRRPSYAIQVCQMRKVASDCLVSYETSRYSVPWKYIRQVVDVQEQDGMIQIYHRGQLIAQHVKATDKHQMVLNAEHYRGLLDKEAPILSNHKAKDRFTDEVQIRSLTVYEALAGGGLYG